MRRGGGRLPRLVPLLHLSECRSPFGCLWWHSGQVHTGTTLFSSFLSRARSRTLSQSRDILLYLSYLMRSLPLQSNLLDQT